MPGWRRRVLVNARDGESARLISSFVTGRKNVAEGRALAAPGIGATQMGKLSAQSFSLRLCHAPPRSPCGIPHSILDDALGFC